MAKIKKAAKKTKRKSVSANNINVGTKAANLFDEAANLKAYNPNGGDLGRNPSEVRNTELDEAFRRGQAYERNQIRNESLVRANPKAVIFREDGHIAVQTLRSEVLLSEMARVNAKLTAFDPLFTLKNELIKEAKHRGLISLSEKE